MPPDPFTPKDRAAFRRRVDWVRDEFPADKPVRVMRTKRICTADCEDKGTHYQIRIAQNPDVFTMSLHLLFHEMGHALEPNGEDHSPAFWHALGMIYRADEIGE